MSYKFPDGAHFYYSKTFATAKTISLFTNASPGVATSVAHGFVDDEELLLTSPWEEATDSVFRCDQLSVDTFSLKGLDTSDTNIFITGGGVGSTVQKISAWQEIPQILGIDVAGGDARTASVNPLSRRRGFTVPLGLNPVNLKLTIGHDAANAVIQDMLSVTKRLTKVAIKQVLADGSASYGYGNLVCGSFPKLAFGNPNTVEVSIGLLGMDVAYG